MSTFVDAAITYLSTDAPLMAYLTGGLYNFSSAGRKGLNRIQLPGAYDSNTGILKPVGIVLELDDRLTGEVVGVSTSRRTPLIFWVYDHGDNGYDTIEPAANRIKYLLHLHQLPNSCQCYWMGTIKDKQEPLLKDAGYYRLNFEVLSRS